jgi:DNA transformation protein
MAVSAQFNAFVLDLLGAVRAVTARRMFGGVGYYADGRCFAIAHDDVLYFRVDQASRRHYLEAGMQAFTPLGPGSKPLNYFTLPPQLYDDEEELATWMRGALAAARAAQPRSRGRAPAATASGRSRPAGRRALPQR